MEDANKNKSIGDNARRSQQRMSQTRITLNELDTIDKDDSLTPGELTPTPHLYPFLSNLYLYIIVNSLISDDLVLFLHKYLRILVSFVSARHRSFGYSRNVFSLKDANCLH